MKLVSYKFNNKPGAYRIGCMIDGRVADLQEGLRALLQSNHDYGRLRVLENLLPADPNDFFSMGEFTLNQARKAYEYISVHTDEMKLYDRQEVNLGTPISQPSKIICVGKNYADHAAEMKSDIPEIPVLFAKFPNALIGPEDAIEKAKVTNKLDYEVELAVVIGKEASQITKAEALDYVAGYTIGNDTSARDLQKRTPQWLQGKTHDRSTPIGPWVVTADDIRDPHNLSIRSFVNGEKRQDSNTNKLIFDIPFLLEFISDFITLEPGDIIMTGTPNGVGVAMDPPQFLKAGDVVTLEIDQIGKMENEVVDQD
ncbi:fumarylacetoacetate hydrolase family protein [Lentibacillus daqui]|uniref:fumarylacetoacetate hydrolase family protein n=1 Tax=Lentibacillus daqui TaxID=2911514 RepID=UPI0022B083E6|nr:fumarylacetoacetate hydrolase family protein [Lentibacillus daqui]